MPDITTQVTLNGNNYTSYPKWMNSLAIIFVKIPQLSLIYMYSWLSFDNL